MLFGELLKQYRQRAGLSQRDLAERSGISDKQVYNLERGKAKAPRMSTVRLLAKALVLTDEERTEFIEAAARARTADGGANSENTAAPRTLPRDSAAFAGRVRILNDLIEAVTAEIAADGVLPIHAVDGMAGIGKTAVMVHAAHQLADRFPDGQIFVPLHAHTPGVPLTDPRVVLGDLLTDEKISPGQIPDSLEARAKQWRSRTAGRRMLMLLDDAASSEQIRPLLPSAPQTLVLVTSRRRLRGLDGLVPVSLEVLSDDEAADLFVRVAARPGLSSADSEVCTLTQLCAYLPLAIRMVAGRLSGHDKWSPGDLIPELTASSGRLPALYDEDQTVAAAFDLSYRDLTETQRELFRLLGTHPGTDTDACAAAALLGGDLTTANRLLRDLEDHHLIDDLVRGRYRMHDLLREHARSLAGSDQTGADDAMARLLDFYVATAQAAARYLARMTPAYVPAVVHPPRAQPPLDNRDQAVAWTRDELDNLIAAVQWAAGRARPQAVALPAAMHAYLERYGPWTTALSLHSVAAETARRLGDRLGLATALANRGSVLCRMSNYRDAERPLRQALDLYRELDSPLGQASVLTELGRLRYYTSGRPAAAVAFDEALELCRLLGDKLGQATIQTERGRLRRFAADFDGAEKMFGEALDLYLHLGNRAGQASVLNDMGRLNYMTAEFGQMTTFLTGARDLYIQLEDLMGEANALDGLGLVHAATGNFADALVAHARARDLYSRLEYPVGLANALDNLGRVRARLGDNPGAVAAHEQAFALYRELGQDLGQANALISLGKTRCEIGDLVRAMADLEEGLRLSLDTGYPQGESNAHDGLGRVRHADRDYEGAIGHYDRALLLFRQYKDKQGEAETMNRVADTLIATGRVTEALSQLELALSLARECGSPADEAEALERIGEIALNQDKTAEGITRLREALAIYERIGLPGADRVQARLRDQDLS
jgi:tetratricopeptide (TPR) repeat protein/transcriptional regulator with XRE-family HTH domain